MARAPRAIHCYYDKSGKLIFVSLGPPPDSPTAADIQVLFFKTATEAEAEYNRLLASIHQ